jgi:hypothetical protein
MWINPHAIISGWKDNGDYGGNGWNLQIGSAQASRYLELADIAISRKSYRPATDAGKGIKSMRLRVSR